MFARQIENYKLIYKDALSMIKDTEKSCIRLRERDEIAPISSTRRYAMPLIILITLAVFVGYFINTKSPQLEFAILRSLFTFLSVAAGYIGTVAFCKYSSKRWFHYEITQQQAETIIAYSYTIIFALNIVLAIIPSLFFMKLLYLYTLYLLWHMSGEYIQIEERFRTYFMFVNGIAMILFPYIAKSIFQLLVPNVVI